MRVPLLGLGVLAAGVLLCVASLVASDRALKTVGTSSAAAANDETMAGMDMGAGSTEHRQGPELRRRRTRERRRPRQGAHAVPRCAAASDAGRRRQGAHGAEGRHDRDRTRHQVRRLGLRGWRARSRRPRAAGTDRRDDAHERRRDSPLDRLPRRPDRAEQGVHRRDARQVLHFPLQGRRPGRVHVPLRHQAGPDAHRQRHVRRDRRRPRDAAPEGRPLVRARRERVVPHHRRPHDARPVRHEQGTGDDARLDDLQRLRRASTSPIR